MVLAPGDDTENRLKFKKVETLDGSIRTMIYPHNAESLMDCLKEMSETDRNRFFIDLGEWVFSDEKILSSYQSCINNSGLRRQTTGG